MEHHANVVPWLMLAEERGIEIRYLPIAEDHTLDLTDLDRLIDGVKLLSFTAMSTVLGTITPMRQLVDAGHAAGALVLLEDRKSVGSGKSVSVRVDLGGRSIIKKKKTK